MSLNMRYDDHHLKKNRKYFFPQHGTALVSSVKESYRQHRHFDVVFLCNNNISVKCHKVVLISVSKYLKQIFEPYGYETVHVSLPEINYRLMKMLINYLYTGMAKLKESELKDFEALLSLLQITCVKRVSKMKMNKPSGNDNRSDEKSSLGEVDLTGENSSNAVSILGNTNPLSFSSGKNILDNTFREMGMANGSIPLSMVQCTSSSSFQDGLKNIQVKLERLDEEEIRSYVGIPNKQAQKSADTTDQYECVTKRKRKYVISVSANQSAPEKEEEKPAPKKKKTTINDCDEMYLEKMFSVEGRPNKIILEELSKELNIEEARLKKWFDDRLAEDKAKGRKGKGNIVTRRRTGKKQQMALDSLQRNVLENEYHRQKCPDNAGKKEISDALNIPFPAVETWFNNRHSKGRRGVSNFIEWEDKLNVENVSVPTEKVTVMNRSMINTNQESSHTPIMPKGKLAIRSSFSYEQSSMINHSVVAVTKKQNPAIADSNTHKENGIVALVEKPRVFERYSSAGKLNTTKSPFSNSTKSSSTNSTKSSSVNTTNSSSVNTTNSSSKKNSVTLDTFQANFLESEFSVQKFPNDLSQRRIAEMLKIPLGAIQTWFRERQSKGRRGISTLVEWEDQPVEIHTPKEKFVRDLSPAERELLEQEYLKDSYPDDNALAEISEKFGLSLSCLRRWYQTKRYGDSSKLFKA